MDDGVRHRVGDRACYFTHSTNRSHEVIPRLRDQVVRISAGHDALSSGVEVSLPRAIARLLLKDFACHVPGGFAVMLERQQLLHQILTGACRWISGFLWILRPCP